MGIWEKRSNDCQLKFNLCLEQPLHLPLTFLPPPGSRSQVKHYLLEVFEAMWTGLLWTWTAKKFSVSLRDSVLIIMESIYWYKYCVIHKIEQQQWLKILLSCILAHGPPQFDLHHILQAIFGARSGDWCRLNETGKMNKLNTNTNKQTKY